MIYHRNLEMCTTLLSIWPVRERVEVPWWKNSSVTFSLHCLLSFHGRQGLQMSAHFMAIFTGVGGKERGYSGIRKGEQSPSVWLSPSSPTSASTVFPSQQMVEFILKRGIPPEWTFRLEFWKTRYFHTNLPTVFSWKLDKCNVMHCNAVSWDGWAEMLWTVRFCSHFKHLYDHPWNCLFLNIITDTVQYFM